MQKKDQNYIKKENTGIVLNLIRTYETISRAQIAKETKMSSTTVSRIVASLIDMNLVKETNQYTSGVGRKARLLSVDSDSIFSIGIELDEKCIRVGVIDFLGRLLFTESAHKEIGEQPQSVVSKLKEMVFRLIKTDNLANGRIIGICIGMPGLIDYENGTINVSTQLGWKSIQFAKIVESELGYPVFIDNELKLKAYAEKLFGNARQSKRMLMIGFGSGVGSALMIDDHIYRGHSNSAGEIGHSIVDPNGILCTCGNFGCLQTYIAERFLLEEASKSAEVHGLEDIIRAAEANEKWAANIIDRCVTYSAITINNSVCLHNPDQVILTGSLIDQSAYIRNRILDKCKHVIWTPMENSFELDISEIGSTGVILGAGMVVQSKFINQLSVEKELIHQ